MWGPVIDMDSWSQPQVSGIGPPGGGGPEDAHLGQHPVMLLYTGFENTGLRWWFTALAARVDSVNTTMTSDRTQNCCFRGPVHTSAKGLKDPEAGEGKHYSSDKL